MRTATCPQVCPRNIIEVMTIKVLTDPTIAIALTALLTSFDQPRLNLQKTATTIALKVIINRPLIVVLIFSEPYNIVVAEMANANNFY